MDTCATSIIYSGSGSFLTTALMKMAKDAAGCETEIPEGETKVPECDNKIHGMKPSSLLSTYATVIGLVAAITMPICGALVDTTTCRRGLGRILSALFVTGVFVTIFVSQDNWFAMSFVFAVSAFLGTCETMTLYAYLPELTNSEDTLNRYTRTFAVFSYTGMVFFLGIVVGVSAVVFQSDKESLDDEINTARLSQSVGFCIGSVLFCIAWGFLFPPRPPTRTLDAGTSIWTEGFLQIYRTAKAVHKNHPMLQWFFVAIAVGDGTMSGLIILAITFLTDVLEFTGAENGTAILIMLLSAIPGGYLSSFWTRRFNPVSSSIAAIVIMIVNTTLVAIFLKGPDQQIGAYILAIGWGVGTGWKWTVDRMLYASLLPPNQNAEFSGAYIFFRQCLTWFPPLVFTILNESNVSLRWGMASLNIFFVIAAAILYFGVGIKRYSATVQPQ